MGEATVYVDANTGLSAEGLNELHHRCLTLGHTLSVVDSSSEHFDEEEVLGDIRAIPPQIRGKVKSSGGHILPISGSGRLNLGNTPVILVRLKGRPVDVYPKMVGGVYYSLRDIGEARSVNLEDSIAALLEAHPRLLVSDCVDVQRDVDSPGGRPDLVLKSPTAGVVVAECKVVADEEAVSQALKQKRGIGANRAAVVCLTCRRPAASAAAEAGVEVYTVTLRKEV